MTPDNAIIFIFINRHAYIARALEYYRKKECEPWIVVADGSETPWPEAAKYKAKYIHLPGSTIRDRFAHVLENSSAQYILPCADDDFVVPESFLKCARFLDGNPEYSAAFGRYVRAAIRADEILFSEQYHNSTYRSLAQDDAGARIQDILSNYIQLFYAVHRRDVLQDFISQPVIADDRVGADVSWERILTILPVAKGKIHFSNKLMFIREQENLKCIRNKAYSHMARSWVLFQDACREIFEAHGAWDSGVADCLDYLVNLHMHSQFQNALSNLGKPEDVESWKRTSSWSEDLNCLDYLQRVAAPQLAPRYDKVRWQDIEAPKEALAEVLLTANILRRFAARHFKDRG